MISNMTMVYSSSKFIPEGVFVVSLLLVSTDKAMVSGISIERDPMDPTFVYSIAFE